MFHTILKNSAVVLDFLKPSSFGTTMIFKNFGSWNTVIEPLLEDYRFRSPNHRTWDLNRLQQSLGEEHGKLPLKPSFTWLYLETTCCCMQWFYSERLESNKWFWNGRDPLTCCLQVAHKHCHNLETTSTTITECKLRALSLTVKLNWKTFRIKTTWNCQLNIFNIFSKCQIRIGISKCR